MYTQIEIEKGDEIERGEATRTWREREREREAMK